MKLVIRRVLNLVLYLSFCLIAGTGFLMAFRLVPGSRGGGGLEVLGWNRHQWSDLHTWVSYFFLVLIVVHLVINWVWLLRVAAQGHPWRLVLGLLVGVVLMGGFFFLPIKERKGQHGRGGHQERAFFVQPEERINSVYRTVSSATEEPATFQGDIRPIMEVACISCHGPKRPKGGFRADLIAGFLDSGEKGPLVQPGNSDQSRLLGIVSGRIKLKGDPEDHLLGAKEIAIIKKWIDTGAH